MRRLAPFTVIVRRYVSASAIQCRPTHRRHQFDICVDVLLACMAGAVTGLIFSESELVPEMQTGINAFMTDGMLQQQDAKVDIWAQPDRWISINLMTSAPTRCA